MKYKLHRGRENEEYYINTAVSCLLNANNTIIQNPKICNKLIKVFIYHNSGTYTFGRSGTGLLHSLIDGHSDVSTLPSIYFSEYFDHSTWIKITSDGWETMVDRFISMYDVLFDATSSVPVQCKSKELRYNIGIKEGVANLGRDRQEVLQVNARICSN